MKRSTLHQIQGVLVEAGRSDLAEEIIVAKGKKRSKVDKRMDSRKAMDMDKDVVVDFDEDTGEYGAFGTPSGFCYQYGSKADMEKEASKIRKHLK